MSADRFVEWRRHIAYLPQDPNPFDASVRENLCRGLSPDLPSEDEACWAAWDAAITGFVRRLAGSLDTQLGARGIRLSGGEPQRLRVGTRADARPKFLVLDEATRAFDDETEAAVQHQLIELRGQCTILLMAHRQSTLAIGDHVVRLGRGRVVGMTEQPVRRY